MGWRNYNLVSLFVSLACLQAGLLGAAEPETPTVSDLRDLFSFIKKEPPQNISISADCTWKEYPKHPISTPEQIKAAIDEDMARFKHEGAVNTPEQEASVRKSLEALIMREITYAGKGKYTEYFYEDKMRLDQISHDGTNISSADMLNEANADVNRSYIVLDTKVKESIPIIIVSHTGKSALKTIAPKADEHPILRNALELHESIITMIGSLLGTLPNAALQSKTRLSDLAVFDPDKAVKLINGSHPSGFKVTLKNDVIGTARVKTFTFVRIPVFENPAHGKTSKPPQTKTLKLEFEVTTTTNCTYISHALVDLGLFFFLDDKWDYGSGCAPLRFTHSVRGGGDNGYDYDFSNISIKEITPEQTGKLFFDDYPTNYFYEDESSGQRVVKNLPAGMGPVKDVDGVYNNSIKKSYTRFLMEKWARRAIIIGALGSGFLVLIFLTIRGARKA